LKPVKDISINTKTTLTMTKVTIEKGKITKKPSTNPTTNSPKQPEPKGNWIQHTKEFAEKNNMSYGVALSNTNNRCQYYDKMIDRTKTYRGPNLLQADHPGMHPFIPNMTPQEKKIKDEILIQTKRHMAGKPFNLNK